MNEFDALLARAVEQARALGIGVGPHLPRVAVNRRAVTRFGCCIRRGGEYVIELSERLLEAEERACMQTLAHEVLHTCPGCRNHGALWKEYAARMNGNLRPPSRTGTCEALGWRMRPVRHGWCERCGQEFCRSRRSRWWITRAVPLPVRWRAAPQQLNLSGEGVPNEKENKKALFNRIFSIAGLSSSAARFWRAHRVCGPYYGCGPCWPSIQPLWLLGAALCVPSAKADALIFTVWAARRAVPSSWRAALMRLYWGVLPQAGPRRRAGSSS